MGQRISHNHVLFFISEYCTRAQDMICLDGKVRFSYELVYRDVCEGVSHIHIKLASILMRRI